MDFRAPGARGFQHNPFPTFAHSCTYSSSTVPSFKKTSISDSGCHSCLVDPQRVIHDAAASSELHTCRCILPARSLLHAQACRE